MAWVRQLPPRKSDGVRLWAATVTTPVGRITESDKLESAIRAWAQEQEVDIRRGTWIDPRGGDITVGAWHTRCERSRHLERASRKRDESHWRVHVAPRWESVKLGGILKTDVSKWVVAMGEANVGAATVEGALGVLRSLLEQAVDDRLIQANPARRVGAPPRDAHVDRVLDADEERQLIARLAERFPDRDDAALFVELLLDTGVRWEEAAAIPPELVDAKRHRVHIAWVMERDGTARPYAKTHAGNRTVAYSEALAARMRAAKLAAPVCPGVFPARRETTPDRLIFTAPEGGPMRYNNWRRRVWLPGLTIEVPIPTQRRPGQRGPSKKVTSKYLDDPQPTAHDMRHTYGSRLADENVPVHEIAALMGHASLRSVQRYLHATEERFKRARDALKRAREA
jgi:site-specific recombinase XerD